MVLPIHPTAIQKPNMLKAFPFSVFVASASSPTMVRDTARLPFSRPHSERVAIAQAMDLDRPNSTMAAAEPKRPKMRQGFLPTRSETIHHTGVANIWTTKNAEAAEKNG